MNDLDKTCGTNSVKRGKCMRRVTFLISLTLNLLTTTIVAPPSNASKWQMGFNLAFKGLKKFYFLDYTLFEVK